ncbi:MAG: hypothetical protein LBT30_01810 [Clostridiales bacterium]|jgi:aspartyl/glutamyl-tRNA(Asn/Gln) amidotransferase C subunit|nr:hypothetical protein [Clostridiales bacterium]
MKSDISIKWLGNLSKIKFDDDGLKKMAADMQSIMTLMDSLLLVEPVEFEDGTEFCGLDALRADTVRDSFDPELLVSQAKDSKDGCFVIPKIL